MADSATVHIGENSREEVAHKLLLHIAHVEGKSIRSGMTGEKADRAYILTTYHECWQVAAGYGPPPNAPACR